MVSIFDNKICILDTSVMLSVTPDELNLPGRRFVILFSVVRELEDKRSSHTLGFFAREWLRFIQSFKEKYAENTLIKDIDTSLVFPDEMPGGASWMLYTEPLTSRPDYADDEIIRFSSAVSKNNEVFVLSNDLPLRLRVFGLGIDSSAYISTAVKDVEITSGTISVNDDPTLRESDFSVESVAPVIHHALRARKSKMKNCLIDYMDESGSHLIARYIYRDKRIVSLDSVSEKPMNIKPRSDEQKAAISYLTDPSISVVSLGGVAGSGKTSLAIATAISAVRREEYEKIVVYRSLHEMGVGQEMGFLPGDVEEKMQPWAGAINDAVEFILKCMSRDKKKSDTTKKELLDLIDVQPITYLRGRSLTNSVIIIEEAQNLSRVELLNVLSRVGTNSKVVLTFDPNQVDNKFLGTGKNSDVWSVVEGFSKEGFFAHITLPKSERSKIAEKASQLLLSL